MKEVLAHHLIDTLYAIASIDIDIVVAVVLLVVSVIVIDAVSMYTRKLQKESGIDGSMRPLSIDGSKTLPVRNYVSDMQGIAGRPDALVIENGFIIPVERKPLARKIHDRYVAQLLIYMRLVEEFEGKKPPYGYLILGPNARRFQIENSPERQAWLQKMLDEMREILGGKNATPTPLLRKCNRCEVRDFCSSKIEEVPQELVKVGEERKTVGKRIR